MKNQCFLLCVMFCFSLSLTAQNGLLGEYYDGTNFNRLAVSRIDERIDMYWNNHPPVAGIDPHECSIRWTGRLKAPVTGIYTFSARVDDGIRVWVGGQKVIDDWRLNDVGVFSGDIKMEAGKFYDLKVEYFNALVEGEITLLWEIPDPDESWFDSWFGKEATVVDARYFFQPVYAESILDPDDREEPADADKKPETPPVKKPNKPAPPVRRPINAPTADERAVHRDTIQKYIPKNIYFERAESVILTESFQELDLLAEFLLRQPKLQVIIEGHTDYVGDAYKNVILSQDRADAVAAYLTQKGVAAERLAAKGFGGSRPLAKNDGRKYHPENRRVEFVIE